MGGRSLPTRATHAQTMLSHAWYDRHDGYINAADRIVQALTDTLEGSTHGTTPPAIGHERLAARHDRLWPLQSSRVLKVP